jgi:hypothetical protein
MRKFVVKGDFRSIRGRRANYVTTHRELLPVDIKEAPFPFWNIKLFGFESIGVDFWKDIILFPTICILARDLFEMKVESIKINNTEYKLPFANKYKPTKKDVLKAIDDIEYASESTLITLCYNYDKNFIPTYMNEIYESQGYKFKSDGLLKMVENIKYGLPKCDLIKNSHRSVIGKTKKPLKPRKIKPMLISGVT